MYRLITIALIVILLMYKDRFRPCLKPKLSIYTPYIQYVSRFNTLQLVFEIKEWSIMINLFYAYQFLTEGHQKLIGGVIHRKS